MSNHSMLQLSTPLASFCLLLGFVASAAADPPAIFNMFHKKQPLTDEAFELKAEHGPWMVFATAIPGEGSRDKAIALARELHESLRQPTFVMQKTFDTSGVLASTTRIVPELDGQTTQYRRWAQYMNGNREQVYAVLVGEFTSMEDQRLDDVLQAIRTAHPQALVEAAPSDQEVNDNDSSNWLIQKYRSVMWSRNNRKENVGPMGAAFVTRNPLLPDEFFLDSPKVDDFVVKLNKNVEHSLLDCKGKYTVRVATFQGKEVTDFGNGSRASQMSDTTDALDKAAFKANKLTTALRRDGVEAYEFHDRYGSYVSIGSFNSLGQERGSGQFQYNTGMLAIMKEYCGYREVEGARDPSTGAVSRITSLNSKDRIPFDIEGKPMAVPRAATRVYGGSLLGRH